MEIAGTIIVLFLKVFLIFETTAIVGRTWQSEILFSSLQPHCSHRPEIPSLSLVAVAELCSSCSDFPTGPRDWKLCFGLSFYFLTHTVHARLPSAHISNAAYWSSAQWLKLCFVMFTQWWPSYFSPACGHSSPTPTTLWGQRGQLAWFRENTTWLLNFLFIKKKLFYFQEQEEPETRRLTKECLLYWTLS